MAEQRKMGAKNHRRLGTAEIAWAKFQIRHSQSTRLSLYRKLASLLKNRFSLMDGLERLYQIASKDGKDPTDSTAVAISVWMHAIQNGDSFSVALHGWAPANELMILSVGDVANLELALTNVIKVVEGLGKMKEPVISAISYPMFLMFMVILLIWMVSVWMVPPMVEATPDVQWKGSAKTLVDLSNFIAAHPILLFSILPVICVIIVVSFPYWKGRLRATFDNFPPWSIYRIFVGLGWLLSLAALVKAGTPVSRALRALRHDATPYLLLRIDRSLFYINNGDNIGEALYKTGFGFPDREIVGDLRIYAELDNFAMALSSLADSWLEDSVRVIEKKAAILNTIAILLIAAVVAWVVFGTFEMQNQMVSRMGLGG